jgi:predicted RNA-binding protein with PIN domain
MSASRPHCCYTRREGSEPVSDTTLYLFDGYNLLHAGTFEGQRELVDRLADFVALEGARGVVVFDGVGQDTSYGPLEVRFAQHADALLERLAAEHRAREQVCLVSSDVAVRGTSGQEVRKLSSQTFLRDLVPARHGKQAPSRLSDRLDEETRARLERLRRGQNT